MGQMASLATIFEKIRARLGHHYGDDLLRYSRAKYFFVLNASLAVILALFLAVFLIPGDRLIGATTRAVFAPLVLAEMALMIFANWQLMAGRFRLAETVVTIANLSAALGAVFLTGGAPGSVALPALLIPACTSFLLSGARLGLQVSLFVAVAVGVQIVASTSFGLVLPDYTSPISHGANVLLVNVPVFSGLIATLWLYEVFTRKLKTQLELERQKLAELALTDELTGLGNSRKFNLGLDSELERARVKGGEMAVLYLDLDDFKQVNDHFGHDAGDAVLRAIAARIRGTVRGQDVAARIGGDEFAVLMPPPVSPGVIDAICEALRRALAEPVRYEGHSHRVGVSIGARKFGTQATSVAYLIKSVDEAMYADKQLKHERKASKLPVASEDERAIGHLRHELLRSA
jgi:diguanylate cyclase (GGDEF)-like protein